MPCACNSRKKTKYVEYNLPPLPLGVRLATNEERSNAPPGTRYPTIQEIKRNPLLLIKK